MIIVYEFAGIKSKKTLVPLPFLCLLGGPHYQFILVEKLMMTGCSPMKTAEDYKMKDISQIMI